MQVCDNGIISFDNRPFTFWRPQRFPTDNPLIQASNVLALFWNDHEIIPTLGSVVKYKKFETGPEPDSGINKFIARQQGLKKFEGKYMIAVSWENVSPYSRCENIVSV